MPGLYDQRPARAVPRVDFDLGAEVWIVVRRPASVCGYSTLLERDIDVATLRWFALRGQIVALRLTASGCVEYEVESLSDETTATYVQVPESRIYLDFVTAYETAYALEYARGVEHD